MKACWENTKSHDRLRGYLKKQLRSDFRSVQAENSQASGAELSIRSAEMADKDPERSFLEIFKIPKAVM